MDPNIQAQITDYQERLYKALEMLPPLEPGEYSLVVDNEGTVLVGPVNVPQLLKEGNQKLWVLLNRFIVQAEYAALYPRYFYENYNNCRTRLEATVEEARQTMRGEAIS